MLSQPSSFLPDFTCLPTSPMHSPWKGVEPLTESGCQESPPKLTCSSGKSPKCLCPGHPSLRTSEAASPTAGTDNLESHFITIFKKKISPGKSNTVAPTVAGHCLSDVTGKLIEKYLKCRAECRWQQRERAHTLRCLMKYNNVGLQRFLGRAVTAEEGDRPLSPHIHTSLLPLAWSPLH